MADTRSVHDHAIELAVSALDFDLEPHERVWLDGHLQGCSACRGAVERFSLDALAMERLPLVSAPSRVEARVLGADRHPPSGPSGALRMLAAVTAAALVAAIGGFALLRPGSPDAHVGAPLGPSGPAASTSTLPSSTSTAASETPATPTDPATPTPLTTPTARTPTVEALRWVPVEVPPDARAREIRTIAVRDDRAVATLVGPSGEPRLWWSDDGGPWRDAELPAGTFGGRTPWLVQPWQDGFVALAWSNVEQAEVERRIWLSPDGLAWRPNVHETGRLGPVTFGVLAASDSAILVAGQSPENETVAWRSADGEAWQRLAVGEEIRNQPVEGLASDGSSFYAYVSDPPSLWRSEDGAAWTPMTTPPGLAGFDGLVAPDGGLVVYGAPAEGDPASQAWFAADGRRWEPVQLGPVPAVAGDRILQVGASPNGLIAVSRLAEGGTIYAESDDGRSWTARAGDGLPAEVELERVARAGSVLVGLDIDSDGRVTAFSARLDE